ncbi:hypothetical protein B0H67DRAFT_477665 [Lasiosphaeris hirsuta]|uniref:Anaphase-promoting complex subunit 2 n=1 Tax=Lasiosphaeris hirsuta TaxID=260670 RepID=A0AA40EB46_9PEZI|nr:hypothetical protein B0H67DRAFT_477665 [Lasiosphaeris hirsuta]
MPTMVAAPWQNRRRRVFQSVFQIDLSQPTPQSTPCVRFPDQGQPFGGPATSAAALAAGAVSTLSGSQSTILAEPGPLSYSSQPLFPSLAAVGDDQVAYDRAWHVVTARIALPPSATADDSFGTLAADSQQHPASQQAPFSSDAEFFQALTLIVHAPTVLPRATHTDDIVAWHAQQVRAHFAQHVIPLLSGCVDDNGDESRHEAGNHYERHMVIVMSSIRTLEAALRLYFYGLGLLMRGFGRLVDGSGSEAAAAEAELLATRFRRDIHALVGNSASEELMKSVSIVLARLAGTILGIPSVDGAGVDPITSRRPAPPTDDDFRALAARQRLHEIVEQLHSVGLAGERFQVLFAEIMESIMSKFVTGAYVGVWAASSSSTRSVSAATNTISRMPNPSSSSPCILALSDWVENHFARLSVEILSRVSPDPSSSPVTLSDVKTYQSLALGRLAALRISELFDIALAWPSSQGALDDLRATITTTARRLQLTASFSRALQTRLLHPGCSTLEILRTYIAIIRTLHALDHSKVLLGHVESSLQLYLCQREDAVRIVVTGLLASPEELRLAKKVKEAAKRQHHEKALSGAFMTPAVSRGVSRASPSTTGRRRQDSTPNIAVQDVPDDQQVLSSSSSTLVELALILNDPSQARRNAGAAPDISGADDDLDWADMGWVPDPVDAGANYKRPRSEDVIGTLISALGSEDVFIKEFASVVAGRLLGEPARFDQEMRVLDLLKRRFGEAALQNCDVMIKDVQDSKMVDGAIIRAREAQVGGGAGRAVLSTPVAGGREAKGEGETEPEYHARILSRLFWPDLDREHFLLPPPIVDYQRWYELGYEHLKSKRKLTWLNQLGQARVELELEDRTVTVDCSTVEATTIYAFQGADDGSGKPVQRSVEELYNELQMDEDLIAEALSFWANKGVLKRISQGVYAVVETIDAGGAGGDGPEPGSSAGGGASNEPEVESPRKASGAAGSSAGTLSAKEQERRAMYWQYIRGMLTNSSASMPLAQVSMMMKMLVPDGFPWSGEELQEFLGSKVASGELEVIGGKYKLVKK